MRHNIVLAVAAFLAGCGGIELQPDVELPQAAITPMPVEVGVYNGKDYREYVHKETRWGSDWKITLGPQHVKMTDGLFAQAFRKTISLSQFPSESAAAPVQAVIEPRIEQYSFITPRDTAAAYYAVTIKYRLNLGSPTGVNIDSYQFTGYGTASDAGMSAEKPMAAATAAAMRDAAAKFLVQFPQQASVKRLISGEPLLAAVVGQGTTEGEEVPVAD
jgi:hypothetical protein